VLGWGHIHEDWPAYAAQDDASSHYQAPVVCTHIFAKEDTLIAAETYGLVFGTADIRAFFHPNIEASARALSLENIAIP
jgi:hypothetical protein